MIITKEQNPDSKACSCDPDKSSSADSVLAGDLNDEPEIFYLREKDVLIGRGRKYYQHAGNKKFREIVDSEIGTYSNATKEHKSRIISDIVAIVRQKNGRFIKPSSSYKGRWFDVGDYLAREKTSQAFRDALHEHYRSSSVSKKKRRHQHKEHDCKRLRVDHGDDDNSTTPKLELQQESDTSLFVWFMIHLSIDSNDSNPLEPRPLDRNCTKIYKDLDILNLAKVDRHCSMSNLKASVRVAMSA